MDKAIFKHFLLMNYSQVLFPLEEEEIELILETFNQYLTQKCTPEQLEKFIPKTLVDVLLKANHPLCIRGFHPALTIHFDNFIKQAVEHQQSKTQP